MRYKLIILAILFHFILLFVVTGAVHIIPESNAEISLFIMTGFIVMAINYNFSPSKKIIVCISKQLKQHSKAEVEIKKHKLRLEIENTYRKQGFLVVTKHNHKSYTVLIYENKLIKSIQNQPII